MARTTTARGITGGALLEQEDVRTAVRRKRPGVHFPIFRWLVYLFLTAGALLFAMPFIWMTTTSLMTANEVARGAFFPRGDLIGAQPVATTDLDRPLRDFLLPTAELRFDGTAATLTYYSHPQGGAFDVYIDDQFFGTVNTHNPEDIQLATVTIDSYPAVQALDSRQSLALPDDDHTLRLVFNETEGQGDHLYIQGVTVVDSTGQTSSLLPTGPDFTTSKGIWEPHLLQSNGELAAVAYDENQDAWLTGGQTVAQEQVILQATNLGFPDYFRACCYATIDRASGLQAMNQRQYVSQNRVSGGHAIWQPPFGLSDQEYMITGGASHYVRVWGEGNFGEYFVNSVIITFLTVSGQTLFAILAAYAFARIRFPGSNVMFSMFLMTLFIPFMVIIIPNLLTVTSISRWSEANLGFKWMDNWPALVVPFLSSTFSIFLLRQFFMQIPDDLWDAAQIDGAGHLLFLFRVVVPISRAAITTVVLFAFIGTWDALEWPILVTRSEDWRPIAVGIFDFRSSEGARPNLLMAASMIALLPVMTVYFFAQKQFTEGIATSGLKG